ncbi:ATPase [Micromonospora sp. PLK6-60]|uniref:ATPase n=1 Tax=Micromonospora sp. PLK6-60 TaxID=2873383 RepID=UPI001CA716DF|nr:ATPase [Micromonospora sp. PLK6-60]MBY8874692.1 ATPase [Micromonospora sp. PLK6-60]
MEFSVVEIGYDQRQVDSCLDEVDARLSRLVARLERLAAAGQEWDQLRREAVLLRAGLARRGGIAADPDRRVDPGSVDRRAVQRHAPGVRREAAEILAAARQELESAREEARQVRERAYAEAVRARREFEAALDERRRRAARAEQLLSGVTVPVDTPTAAAGVPATRVAAGATDAPVEPEPDARVA